jgi:hypothetical protein
MTRYSGGVFGTSADPRRTSRCNSSLHQATHERQGGSRTRMGYLVPMRRASVSNSSSAIFCPNRTSRQLRQLQRHLRLARWRYRLHGLPPAGHLNGFRTNALIVWEQVPVAIRYVSTHRSQCRPPRLSGDRGRRDFPQIPSPDTPRSILRGVFLENSLRGDSQISENPQGVFAA